MCSFSFIVPVYNAEKYLVKCLDSIKCQDYKHWECLLIDDGSTDCSGRICDKYSAEDSRFVTIHKKNEGVSSARNLGIEKAKNEWVIFLDADDFIESVPLDDIFSNDNCDLIITGHKEIYDQSTASKSLVAQPKLLTSKDFSAFLSENLQQLSLLAPWAKAFKRTILLDNNIRFNRNLRLFEDNTFCFTYLLHVNSIFVTNKVFYNYRIFNIRKYSYAMNQEETSLHLKVVHEAEERLVQKWDVRNHFIRSFRAMSILSCYIMYIERDNLWKTEPYENIKAFFCNPLFMQDYYSSKKKYIIRKILMFVAKYLHLYRQLLLFYNKLYFAK